MKTKLIYLILKILTATCIAWLVIQDTSGFGLLHIASLQIISCIGGVVVWFTYDKLRKMVHSLSTAFRIIFWSTVIDAVFIILRSFTGIENFIGLDGFEALVFLMLLSWATLFGVINFALRLKFK